MTGLARKDTVIQTKSAQTLVFEPPSYPPPTHTSSTLYLPLVFLMKVVVFVGIDYIILTCIFTSYYYSTSHYTTRIMTLLHTTQQQSLLFYYTTQQFLLHYTLHNNYYSTTHYTTTIITITIITISIQQK